MIDDLDIIIYNITISYSILYSDDFDTFHECTINQDDVLAPIMFDRKMTKLPDRGLPNKLSTDVLKKKTRLKNAVPT